MTKGRAQNQAPNVCLNGIPREIAGKKTQKKTARGTYTCLKACTIVDLHYTLAVVSRFGDLLLTAA